MRRSTCPVALRLRVVGVGGPGMSRHRDRPRRDGPRRVRQRLRDQPVLDRVRAAGVDVRVGHDRSRRDGLRRGHLLDGDPARQHRARRRGEQGIPRCARAGMLASICGQARPIGVAGTHGKTTTTSMLMLILAAARTAPSFVVGGDVDRRRHGRPLDGQRAGSSWRADESDGTHLELPLARHDPRSTWSWTSLDH